MVIATLQITAIPSAYDVNRPSIVTYLDASSFASSAVVRVTGTPDSWKGQGVSELNATDDYGSGLTGLG